jgi:hypothetical protein
LLETDVVGVLVGFLVGVAEDGGGRRIFEIVGRRP